MLDPDSAMDLTFSLFDEVHLFFFFAIGTLEKMNESVNL